MSTRNISAREMHAVHEAWRHRSRARARAEDRSELETLMTCAACDGTGMFVLNDDPRHHKSVSCPWCGGMGMTDTHMIVLFMDRFPKSK